MIQMTIRHLLALFCLLSFTMGSIVGCTNPRIRYESISPTSEDIEGKNKFRLSRSLILIESRPVDSKKPQDGSKLVAQSVPTDSIYSADSLQEFTLQEVADFFSETKLDVAKIDNTDLISEIGVEVFDKLKDNLEKAGAVVGTALKFGLAAAAADEPIRSVIDVKDYTSTLKSDSKQIWQDLPLNTGWVYKLDLQPSPKPAGAIETKKFFSSVKGKSVAVFPMSACFDATLYLYKGAKQGPGTSTEWDSVRPFQMKIADPDYVQTLALPSKGKIKMHSSCGASITSEKEGTNPVYAILESAIKQAEAIKKAIDDSKKTKDSK